jgi:hemerythrin superfamily protein
MKRTEMLTSLSHDHHQALRVSQLLRRSETGDAEAVREGFEQFWGPHQNHIRLEEEVLFPKFAEFAAEDDPMLAQAFGDHGSIRALADAVLTPDAPPVEAMHQLAEVLHDHVRFEERDLFPAIEAAIPEDQQAALLAALEHADPGPGWQPGRE